MCEICTHPESYHLDEKTGKPSGCQWPGCLISVPETAGAWAGQGDAERIRCPSIDYWDGIYVERTIFSEARR